MDEAPTVLPRAARGGAHAAADPQVARAARAHHLGLPGHPRRAQARLHLERRHRGRLHPGGVQQPVHAADVPHLHDGPAHHHGPAPAGRGAHGGEDHPRHAHVQEDQAARGGVRVPQSHHHAQPIARGRERAGDHPGALHDLPEDLRRQPVPPAAVQIPRSARPSARGAVGGGAIAGKQNVLRAVPPQLSHSTVVQEGTDFILSCCDVIVKRTILWLIF